ncbi:hypothetical protein GAGA_0561 [Paraglaciecola agarilytica NO2]|uniref:Uncharacterized protein n=1 Tax=Paraglaciecola agarilytica NO2 TaxID=1125747 RepID=A0ABQ0I285_9ALTE|nr:hypothetical protein GAGA_0561 [Paraglaciecola agarilytica NO2]
MSEALDDKSVLSHKIIRTMLSSIFRIFRINIELPQMFEAGWPD